MRTLRVARSLLASTTRSHALALAVIGALACGCQGGADKAGAPSDGFPAPSQAAVYEAARRALEDQHYDVDSEASSPEQGVVTSRWRQSLSPFSRDGYREMATVRIFPATGRPGYFRTETNVTRENNLNVEQPSNPLVADWSDGRRNALAESVINRRIEMSFLPSDVSPRFRERYGLPDAEDPRLPATVDPSTAAPPQDDPFWDERAGPWGR